MNYSTVKDMAVQLSYDDKLRLASLMLQMAITKNSLAQTKQADVSSNEPESADYQYCLERILKSKPNKLTALKKFLEAMLEFRGGESTDINDIIKRLQFKKVIRLDGEVVVYLS
ncbi:MAG: hypothetical protein Q4G13_09705 [Moraxella sp.]|nr:hypothetical protein [Moraxella sp.]